MRPVDLIVVACTLSHLLCLWELGVGIDWDRREPSGGIVVMLYIVIEVWVTVYEFVKTQRICTSDLGTSLCVNFTSKVKTINK